MLILTRRIQEALVIGDDIEVVVLDVRGSQVRLGIKAPDDVPILREELIQEDDVAAHSTLRAHPPAT